MNRRNFLKIMCGTGAALLSSRWNILKGLGRSDEDNWV